MRMVMPKMGMTMEEGTIVEWKKRDGEYVKKGEVILEIMTNKVNIDVEAPASGYLKVLKGPDDVVPVDEVIALIEVTPAEAAEKVAVIPSELKRVSMEPEKVLKPEMVITEEVTGAVTKIPASPRARMLAEEKGIPLENIRGTGPDGAVTEKDVLKALEDMGAPVSVPVKPPVTRPESVHAEPVFTEPVSGPSGGVSPLAERIARDKGVDLSKVRGTGIGGKITKEDVLGYIEKGGEPEIAVKPEIAVEPEVALEPEAIPSEVPVAVEPQITEPEIPEKVITESVIEEPIKPVIEEPIKPVIEEPIKPVIEEPVIPERKYEPPLPEEVKGIPLTGIKKLTAERMLKSKKEAPHLTLGMEVDMTEASKLKSSLNVSFTDILVKAVALALRKHPVLNSTLRENRIILRENINIGIAVARGDDLLVPVIHDADRHSIREISRLTTDIIERTRENNLTEKDVLDGTFTISNLGMYGIDFFTPIINPPEAAILGVGRIEKKPVIIEDQIRIREMVHLSLSFDHRIVNGMPAALFLSEIRNLLEHPYRLLVEGET